MRKLYQTILSKLTPPIIGLIFLGCFFGINGYAQPFPVSVNTQLSSPSLPYLADYIREKPEALRVILLLNDDSRLDYEVLLKVRISGQGIELASREDFFSTPINLLFNVPEVLTGFELADLFDPNNLDISGMSRSEFLKTGQLPEGIYTICFEAYDVNQFDQRPVSNGGCAVASVIEHEPPYLIKPTGKIAINDTSEKLDINLYFYYTESKGIFERDNSQSEWKPKPDLSIVKDTPQELLKIKEFFKIK